MQAPSPEDGLCGMSGSSADPAALLAIYLQFDRLPDAADLVLDYLGAYQKVHCFANLFQARVLLLNQNKVNLFGTELKLAVLLTVGSCIDLTLWILSENKHIKGAKSGTSDVWC